ncbi:MAG: type II methionyl aminopeptidase [Verrucomicrobia bacterium]|nr:type II methionyl aminopeptidase [Verrucomicrobiota bacterium]
MNETYKQNFLRAGAIAKEVRAYGKSLIKPGASYNDVIAQIYRKISELGAIPAFPPQIALDHIAAHFLPQPDEDILFSTQVVKLDVGVCVSGAIGDCAVTIDLSGKYQPLIDAAEAALLAAEQILEVGLPIREIGKAIEMTIISCGFKPVRNLSGHGLGVYQVHTPPGIPNYDDRSRGVLTPGMTFAIEPFATDGKGMIYEAGRPGIFSFAASRPVHSDFARSLIPKIKSFQGLPFSIHDLAKDLPLPKVHAAVDELLDTGVINGYAPFIEEGHGMVAQAENSVLIDEKGKVFITTR